MIDKICTTADQAVADINSGFVVGIGGFVELVGIPSVLIKALGDRGLSDLTLIANDVGRGKDYFDQLRIEYDDRPDDDVDGSVPVPPGFYPPSYLVDLGQVSRVITSFASQMHLSSQGPLELAVKRGDVELELLGQGTLAERLRASRAGIPAFYTPVGVGTLTAVGKEVRDFDGVPHVLETALKPDVALIAATKADRFGNLSYRGTSRALNPVMAGSARLTIAEVDEVVEVGELTADEIITPGVYVDRVVDRRMSAEYVIPAGRSLSAVQGGY